MVFKPKNKFFFIFLEIILTTRETYYISFDVIQIDDCLSKIYKNNNINDIIYQKPSETECTYLIIPDNPVVVQYEFVFGDEYFFEVEDSGHYSCIGVNAKINEYLIKPKLQRFWRCINCISGDGNYLYNSESDEFSFYEFGTIENPSKYYMSFKINTEEELTNLYDLVDKNFYTLQQSEIAYIYLDNFFSELTLVNLKNKTNFFITSNKSYKIPFETIYFQIKFDENITHSGKIMGFNFITKRYEELYNNSYFQINNEYSTLNFIFSEKDKNNHGSHIKIYILTYNIPSNLLLSQTVSNLGIFEFYICKKGYKVCDNDFYFNCISEFKCYEHCPHKINNNNNKCNYCHPDCDKCSETFNENSNNCLSCSSYNKYLKNGNCVSECKNGYYNDKIEDSIIIKKCKCDLDNCYECSLESLSMNNSCITCNQEKGYFQLYDDINYNNNFIKCYKLSEGYYLDNTDSTYKKCYESCKYCNISGNSLEHNCLKCKDNYNYIMQYEKYKNCYNICPNNYYYFDDEINELYCTKGMKCMGKYNKLIFGNYQCIDECNKVSKYNFRNICYPSCPEGSKKSEIISFFCEIICYEEKPFEIIYEQECSNNCSIDEIKRKNCLIKYEYNKNNTNEEKYISAQDVILENFRNEINYENYNTTDIDNGNDDIFEDKKMKITITTSENQKNKIKQENNETQINLGQCEYILREYNNLTKDNKIYIKKIDKKIEGMKIPKIEYDVYYKQNHKFIQVNISKCNNIKIDVILPITINEEIDILNSSSDYYNSICYPTRSIYGTDLILDDRRKEFIDKNKTICQENCVFSEYDLNFKKAKCSCDIQKSSNFFNEINFNKTLLYRNFIDINNIANIKILGCYKELLNKKGIIKNIGFYILLLMEIIHLICTIIFYCKELKILGDYIYDITFAIKNWELVIKEEKENLENNKSKKKKTTDHNSLIKFNKKKKDLNELEKNQEEGIIGIPTLLDNHRRYINFPNNPIKKRKKLKKNDLIKSINTENSSTIKKKIN